MIPLPTDLLPSADVSAMLGVAEATLQSWRKGRNGSGPRWIKVGKGVRYRRSDLEAWIEAQERDGPT